MGLSESKFEQPSPDHTATLHYLGGRGVADQIRWMMAATDVDFTQITVQTREKMVKLCERQLPFGQLPLLQIDGLELVQSQAAVRYIARRGNLIGLTPEETVRCDMIAESVRDMLGLLLAAPFKKYKGVDISEKGVVNETEWQAHLSVIKTKWSFFGARLEAILSDNMPAEMKERMKKQLAAAGPGTLRSYDGPAYAVGTQLTYADILMAHLTTWIVEECGRSVVENFPLLVAQQNNVISLPGIRAFLKGDNYFPIGNLRYVKHVAKVLDRDF